MSIQPFIVLSETPTQRLEKGEFPCVQCGACCRSAHSVPGLVEAGYAERGKKGCKFLQPGNSPPDPLQTPNYSCAIYPVRPPICRVLSLNPKGVSKIQWFLINLKSCLQLVKSFGDYPPSVEKELKILIESLERE